eukprot:jgi/Tetstr1/441817/TSEL_030033.t2
MHIDELRVFMKYSLKVSCSSLKRVKNNQDSVQISATGRSPVIGKECADLVCKRTARIDWIFEDILEGQQQEKYADAKAAWQAFEGLWNQLKQRTGTPDSNKLPPQQERDDAAAVIQAMADKFVDALARAAGLHSSASSVYMHNIKCHLSEAVKLYGKSNLMDYSCHSSEHVHQLIRDAYINHTSGHLETRIAEPS